MKQNTTIRMMLSDYDGDPSALAKEVGSVDGPIPVLITRNLIPFPLK